MITALRKPLRDFRKVPTCEINSGGAIHFRNRPVAGVPWSRKPSDDEAEIVKSIGKTPLQILRVCCYGTDGFQIRNSPLTWGRPNMYNMPS